MSEMQVFNGLINCMTVTKDGEIIVAHDFGITSLSRGMLSINPVDAITCSDTNLFTISLTAKFQKRDMQGGILQEFELNMPEDSSRECLYSGLAGQFFLCNMGVHPNTGIWQVTNPDSTYTKYRFPVSIRGRRVRGLAWHDNHFWLANQLEQKIYKLAVNTESHSLLIKNVLQRSLPTSSGILGIAWHGSKLYVAFQVGEETEIHIYEGEATPRRHEKD